LKTPDWLLLVLKAPESESPEFPRPELLAP
jgi:hypothetical protein